MIRDYIEITDFDHLKCHSNSSVFWLALGILESLEQEIHTYTITRPHLLLHIILLSVQGLCSSPVIETLNIMAYPDLIAIYCLLGCHAAAGGHLSAEFTPKLMR